LQVSSSTQKTLKEEKKPLDEETLIRHSLCMSKYDTDSLQELIKTKEAKTHMTISMPKSLKGEIKTFCDEKGINLKDLALFSIKQTLKKYSNADAG